MIWEAFLRPLCALVTFSTLVKNDVDDFIVLADILCWQRHELVDDLAKERDIAACISTNS